MAGFWGVVLNHKVRYMKGFSVPHRTGLFFPYLLSVVQRLCFMDQYPRVVLVYPRILRHWKKEGRTSSNSNRTAN